MSPRSPYLTIRASAELKAAIKAHCQKLDIDESDYIRSVIAVDLGDESLAAMRSRGQPRKDADPEPAAKPVRGRPKKDPK